MSRNRSGNFRSWTRETSRLAHAAKARKRLAGPAPDRIDRPEPGRLLKTIRITDEISGASVEIKLRQAARLNQVVAETFGRQSSPHGVDYFTRELRKRWLVTRWITQTA